MLFNKYSSITVFFVVDGVSKMGLRIKSHGKFPSIAGILETVVSTSYVAWRLNYLMGETNLENEPGGCISLDVMTLTILNTKLVSQIINNHSFSSCVKGTDRAVLSSHKSTFGPLNTPLFALGT